MDVGEVVAIALAGLAAGAINTVVGSGTLITFPVLLAFGYSPVTANVSNTIGLVPGSVSGAVGYRRELEGQRRRDAAPGHRLAPRRHHRRGAAAGPARLGVQGDRAGLHRHRAGARRPAAAPEPDAGRAPDQPRERGRAVDAARGLRRRRLRRLLRRRPGDPPDRLPRRRAPAGPAAHERAEERPHRDRQRRRRRATSSSRPTSPGRRPRSSPAPRSSAARSARTTGAGYTRPCCAA